jgi:hypothetical protein
VAPNCFDGNKPVTEFTDPVFAKTSPKRAFSMTENERFELVFVKTGSINYGTGLLIAYNFDSKGGKK